LENLDSPGFESGSFALVFMATHGISLLLTGFLARERKWRNLMQGGAALCLLGNLALFATRFLWLPLPIAAMMGLSSGCFVIGWTYPYSQGLEPEKRLSTMALIIFFSNILLFITNTILQFTGPWPLLLVSGGALVMAVICTVRAEEPAPNSPGHWDLPKLYLPILILFVLLIYVNGGLLYSLAYPSVAHLPVFQYFRLLIYMVLLLALALWLRIKVSTLVYLGASLMGISFVLWASQDLTPLGAVTVPLVESSFAFIDLVAWTAPAAIAYLTGRPFRVFGLVLSANVGAIFVGYLLGENFLGQERYQITMGLLACTLIFLAFLLLPWLKDLDQENEERSNIQIPNWAGLTPREQEILSLLLEGHSNKIIAGKLYISENTLKPI
jgi:MFS family permease